MVDQTFLKDRNGHTDAREQLPARGMATSVKDLLHDAITLSELQCKLLLLDLREGSSKMIAPIVVIVMSLCLALGCFPIGLAALGLGLNVAGIAMWGAFLIAFGAGLLVSGLAAYVGWRWLKSELSIIQRSQAEFHDNMAWLKTALKK